MVDINKVQNLQEDKITKQVTITAGTEQFISFDVPEKANCFLKGLGYTWYTDNTYIIDTGNKVFSKRTDQLGSASIPHIWSTPFYCKPSGKTGIWIKNGDSSDHTYDIVFYVLSDIYLNVESSGGELILATGSSGSVASEVAIFNSSKTTVANVTSKGLEVDPQAPATLICNMKAVTTTGAAIASSTAVRKATLQVDDGATGYILIGNATNQLIKLSAGDSVDIEIDDLAKIYAKASAGTITLNFMAS